MSAEVKIKIKIEEDGAGQGCCGHKHISNQIMSEQVQIERDMHVIGKADRQVERNR